MVKANCAGQGCVQRETCRRYKVAIPDGKRWVAGQEVPIVNWASFDIEAAHFGSCESFVRFRG